MCKYLFYFLAFSLINCSAQPFNEELEAMDQLLSDWVASSPSVSKGVIKKNEENSIEIILIETDSSGSSAIEKISSENLAFKLNNLLVDSFSNFLTSIKITFDLPQYQAVYGKENKKVNISYEFNEENIKVLDEYLSNKKSLFVSDYITFKMTNYDANELSHIGGVLKDLYSWYQYKEGEELLVFYHYALAKANDKKKLPEVFLKYYEVGLSTLYSTTEIGSKNAKEHLNKLYSKFDQLPYKANFNELDSLGKLYFRQIKG